jgi:hypothetical protein
LRHYVFIVQAVFYTDNSVCVCSACPGDNGTTIKFFDTSEESITVTPPSA